MDATSSTCTSATSYALGLDELVDSLVASHSAFVEDLPYTGPSGCLASTRALLGDEMAELDSRLTGEEDRHRLALLKAWLEQEVVRLEPWFEERGEPRPSWVVGRRRRRCAIDSDS